MIAAPIHVPANGRTRVEKLTNVQVLVFDSFGLSADDVAIWTTHLLTEALTDAGLALKVQQLAMVSAGIPQGQAIVPGSALTTMLQSHAATVAQGVSRTYNSALLAFMEKSGAEKPTWNRNQWASALEKWDRDYWSKQTLTISVSELSNNLNTAIKEFIRENLGQVKRCRVEPRTAQCPICQSLVDLGWMSAQDGLGLDLPPHPNCPHFLRTEYQ